MRGNIVVGHASPGDADSRNNSSVAGVYAAAKKAWSKENLWYGHGYSGDFYRTT